MDDNNRVFLQLAGDFDEEKHSVGGWYMSEKLDGMRCFWDGGISRYKPASEMPWANTAKDDRLVNQVICTGLWSRYGKVIHAPPEWLDMLPKGIPLDGELYAGKGQFQDVMSICKKHEPSVWDWMNYVRYHVFDCVAYRSVFQDGRIYNPNFSKIFSFWDSWSKIHRPEMGTEFSTFWDNSFTARQSQYLLKNRVTTNDIVIILEQTELPYPQYEAVEMITKSLEKIVASGGEGLMLRKPDAIWKPKRHDNILKVKKFIDSEATVIGYISGERTDKGSKLLGMCGALILDWDNKIFALSGLNDNERELTATCAGDDIDALGKSIVDWARENPGQKLPHWGYARHFPKGTKITFRYNDLTKDGIPKNASYHRKFIV